MRCCFVSDLHGNEEKYAKLNSYLRNNRVDVLFNGGDLLPSGTHAFANNTNQENFVVEFLIPEFEKLRSELGGKYPEIFLIMGNDDARIDEKFLLQAEEGELWHYVHNKKVEYDAYKIFGYSFVPPTPFLLKDWEKYDVSRYVDPGCISPEDGFRTMEIRELDLKYSTIKKDIEELTKNEKLDNSIFLFHTPPYKTKLDRAALDGKKIDHVPMDVHVGSIAIKRFIENRQPLLTLHGHIHESTRLTKSWEEKIGNTTCFNAAHDGKELCVINFDSENLEKAERILI